MNRLTITLIAACIGACLIAPFLAVAEVESMSSENFRESDGVSYWVVAITCKENRTEKLMMKIVGDGSSWCSADDSSLCNDSKTSLSQELCGSIESVEQTSDQPQSPVQVTAEPVEVNLQSPSVVEDNAPAPANNALEVGSNTTMTPNTTVTPIIKAKPANQPNEDRKTMLLREQVKIEEQRILIEQQRLDLVQEELALKKQSGN